MPTVAIVDGIKIQFYHDEHPPIHFHAEFAEHQAMIGIDSMKVLKGYLPRPQLRKVVAWPSRANNCSVMRGSPAKPTAIPEKSHEASAPHR
jgi:hypothetical protein